MNVSELRARFSELFGGECRVFFAPGRVNLIGEYTDFNGGHVLPFALGEGTYLGIRPRTDGAFNMFSVNFPASGVVSAPTEALSCNVGLGWCDYPLGVLWALRERGLDVRAGADMLFFGDIPSGAGLSSSASIEVLTAYAFNAVFNFGLALPDMALIGRRAENEYVGVNCGIMDQFVIALGRAGCAVFLDTETLEFEYVPANIDGAAIMLMNTNKRRSLGESKYNERRRECEEALRDVNAAERVESWGVLDEAAFERLRGAIKDEASMRRARHAVSENLRTVSAVSALRAGSARELGRLMTASHASLRDDFEVTGVELDALVESALRQRGVFGARMTGAGFGGCAVALVEAGEAERFTENVKREYYSKTGLSADIWRVCAGGGPREEA